MMTSLRIHPSARVVVALIAASSLALVTSDARAKGGSSLSAATSASVSGSNVSGVITVTNSSSKSETVRTLRQTLEVRFPSGVTPPAGLPAGSSSGWYTVASAALPVPVIVGPNGSTQISYSLSTCGASSPPYPGAKDMRIATTVTASQTVKAQSLNYALPAKCAVCGNGKLEAGEQCEPALSSCCTSSCRPAADGVACNDGNACTRVDQCQAGVCTGGDLVGCSAADSCHVTGICSPTTGLCSNPIKTNGSACDDGNACTLGDSCQSGACRGSSSVTCSENNPCLAAACNPSSGTCSSSPKRDGTECIDGDACTVGDQCIAGNCASGAARDCNDHMICTSDSCEAATGCDHGSTRCDACDAGECAACSDACDVSNDACGQGCWASFLSCLNHCTTTYCAPFCQVDLGRCLDACPAPETCKASCEAGNACAPACTDLP